MKKTCNQAKEKLQKSLLALLQPGPYQVPGLGISVYKQGKCCFTACFGQALLEAGEREARAFTRNSLFRIASVSKQFTVFTVLQLVEEGRLALDADVSEYLGFRLRHPAYPATPITVRLLASHTSGIRDGRVYATPPECSLKEFFVPQGRYYENGDHFSPEGEKPGAYFCYCNLNYGLLGTIIEAVTQERFDLYQKQHILRQLDIEGGYLPNNLALAQQKLLGGCYRRQQASEGWETAVAPPEFPADVVQLQNPYAEHINGCYSLEQYQPGHNATAFSPQGGLWLSLKDMEHTLKLWLDQGVYQGRRVLSAQALQEMQRPQWLYNPAAANGEAEGVFYNYGLAQYQPAGNSKARLSSGTGIDLVGHTGQAFGLLSGIFMRPGTQDGFCYIMNGEGLAETDPAARGRFSGNLVWEEILGEAVCGYLQAEEI